MNENETHQNYIEEQCLIMHGLELLKEKTTRLNEQTSDEFLKESYKTTLPRINKLISQTERNIINGK